MIWPTASYCLRAFLSDAARDRAVGLSWGLSLLLATLTSVAALPLLVWSEWSQSCGTAVLAAAGYGRQLGTLRLGGESNRSTHNCSDVAWRDGELMVLVCSPKLEPIYGWGPFQANFVKA
eukprot:2312173-Amphidinium_carterae.1